MGLKVTHEAKPVVVSGVQVTQIPQELKDALAAEWKFIQANPDNDVVLTADTKAEAAQYALYARAWGNGHLPRLEVRKVTQRKSQPVLPENVVKLSIKPFDPEAKRPGRPAAS
jgi:hypothetical protein